MSIDKSKRWIAVLRTLHQSDRLNSVSEGAEVLYRRLLEVCDDNGNYHAAPGLVLGYAMAHRMASGQVTVDDVKKRIAELASVNLVVVYAGGKLLHIVNHYSRLRKDTLPDIRFDRYESVTDPLQTRNGCVTLDRTVPNRTEPYRTEPNRTEPTSAPSADDAVVDEVKPKRKPRKLTQPALDVKACLDAYVAGYAEVSGHDYSGEPPAGAVVRWLGSQPTHAGGVAEFCQKVGIAVKAGKLDPQFHGFPMTVPKFVGRLPEIDGAYLAAAKRNASKGGRFLAPEPGDNGGAESKRRQCYSDLSDGKHDGRFCGRKAYCQGCPGTDKTKRTGETRSLAAVLPKEA